MTPTPQFPTFGLSRRHLLGGALAAGMAQLIPGSWAADAPATGTDSFMALSRYLTERGDLPQAQGARLLAAQNELDGKFKDKLETLWKWIGASQVALAHLNERLKAEQPDLADVPMNVMQLWYQGIAGSGTATRVVAYEHALNADVVADRLRPPSYVYGAYGSWSSNPTTFKLQLITVQPKA